jgi:hypothetical protein
MVEAVLFDLFETLVTESGTEPTRLSRLGSALGWRMRRSALIGLRVVGPRSLVLTVTSGLANPREVLRQGADKADTTAIQEMLPEAAEQLAGVAAVSDDAVAVIEVSVP